jgi:hypothetical protein
LTVRTGYTFSKTTDNVSEIFGTNTAGNNVAFAQNQFDVTNGEHSLSGLNIPNAFTVNFVEQLPFFREQHGLLGHVLGGWALSADYIWASGQPYTPQQLADARLSALGNFYDTAFVANFVGGVDTARAFTGNINAPSNAVGIFAGDACLRGVAGAAGTALTCALPATQLLSLNALNSLSPIGAPQPSIVGVTANDVRLIMNARTAQQVFGTPFGNSPRNALADAPSNIANMTVIKGIKLGEKANFEMRLTANNAFNHFNFSSVDPFLNDAGKGQFGTDFANPAVTSANGRTVFVGARITF